MKILTPLLLAALLVPAQTQRPAPGAGPTIVLETVKGTIEIETYPDEAPKTVERIIELIRKNFYTGLRFHRAEPNFVVQVGDPTTRDVSKESWWGRQGSGKPMGFAEITKKRRHVRGAVSMAHPGNDPKLADSQFFIMLRAAPELDGKHTVFGRVINGMDVVERLRVRDVLRKASVRE
jgi:cyclophilin family peptidyl-prolyl cis-trans isomerase